VVEVRAGGVAELFVTARPRVDAAGQGEAPAALYGRIAQSVAGISGQIITERCYAPTAAYREVCEARARAYAARGIDTEGVLCFVGQDPCEPIPVAGVQLWIARAPGGGARAHVLPVVVDGRVVGRRFCLRDFDYLSAPSIGPRADLPPAASLKDRAVSMFEQSNRILAAGGLDFRDVARTWIYVPELLSWYGEFNAARRHAFRKAGLLDGGNPVWLPASTGIQGSCPEGRDCMMDLLALARRPGRGPSVRMVASPGQCEAYAYGSSFARAVEIKDGSTSRVYVSGTASIDEGGKTVHVGDVERQIRHTIQVVRDLLDSRGHGLGDIAHGVMFLKSAGYLEDYRRVAREEGLDCRMIIEVVADVCREDLLVELEVMSVVPVAAAAASPHE
jgi:enamine deaminase RidA (YjgF/YER057c/UK114 family)